MKNRIGAMALAGLLLLGSLSGCGKTPPVRTDTSIPASDWLVTQTARDAESLAELEGGYDQRDPLVILDPYGAAPLTALVMFDTEHPCSVAIAIPGDSEGAAFHHDFATVSTRHQIPVYGLYPGRENRVELTLTYADGGEETVTVPITTDPLPDYIAPYEVTVDEHDPADGELLYLSMTSDLVHPFAVDCGGDVRWYASHPDFSKGIFRRLENGRFLTFSTPLYAPAILQPGVVEVDRMGRVYREYLYDMIHHDMIELPSGNLLLLTVKPGSLISLSGVNVGLDRIVELDRATGQEVRAWDLNELCGYTDQEVAAGRYLHCNALWYDAEDDAILFSAATAYCVVKLDAATGEILWALADPRHDYPEPIASKILTPVGECFEWQGLQHAVMLAENGDVLMLDNGTGRLDAQGEPVADEDNYTRLIRYRVDPAAGTVEQIYQYGKERGNELYATYLGDVDELGPDHYLMTAGGRVLDPDGRARGSALDIYMGIKAADAKIVEIKDGGPVFELRVGDGSPGSLYNIYRAEWDKVYAPGQGEYDLSAAGSRYGSLLPSARMDYGLPTVTEPLEGFTTAPVDYGYQLNVPIRGKTQAGETLLLELKKKGTALYYDTVAAGGAQAIVRASGLEPGTYGLALVRIRADGTVGYLPLHMEWDCRPTTGGEGI